MIQLASFEDAGRVARLETQLWPEHEEVSLLQEVQQDIASGNTVYFICCQDTQDIGFAQCGLRHDYVEGTHSSPVGYLEGIYVPEGYRRQGIARALLAACEAWARAHGCMEFASDCEAGNDGSLAFHLGAGFREANRLICFSKRL